MTITDWAEGAAKDIQRYGIKRGVARSGIELAYGGVRRVENVRPIGETIWDRKQDWDVLVVLDTCRFDMMQKFLTSDADEWATEAILDSMWSVGSCSYEWIDRTFTPDVPTEETALLSGNPFTAKTRPHTTNIPLDEGDFALLWEAWRSEWGANGIPTIPPRPLTKSTVATWRQRNELGVKRVVTHLMQPHFPFLQCPDFGPQQNMAGLPDREGTGEDDSIFERGRQGEYTRQELWELFYGNLLEIAEDIRLLTQNIDGDVVFTADHGNGLGEWGVWGHPSGALTPEVRRVPWVSVEASDERTLDGKLSRNSDEDMSTEDIDERLAALGYR